MSLSQGLPYALPPKVVFDGDHDKSSGLIICIKILLKSDCRCSESVGRSS